MFRRIDTKKVHQLLGLDVVVLNECLNGVFVFLGTYVLVSGEIGYNIETFLLAKDTLEDRICKIEGITAKLLWHIESFSRTHITNQLSQSVLVEVNDNDTFWFKAQHRLYEAGTD